MDKAQHNPTLLVQLEREVWVSSIQQCWLLAKNWFTQVREQVDLMNYLSALSCWERYMLIHTFLNFYTKRTLCLLSLSLFCVANKNKKTQQTPEEQLREDSKNMYILQRRCCLLRARHPSPSRYTHGSSYQNILFFFSTTICGIQLYPLWPLAFLSDTHSEWHYHAGANR